MDPGIDVDVVAVNAAADRGGGLDWTASLTFDTDKSCPSTGIEVVLL